MRKIKLALPISFLVILIGLVLVFQPVWAGKLRQPSSVINIQTGKAVASIIVPLEAIGNSQAIISLGSALDNGKEVEGLAIIHYKNYGKPDKPGKPRNGADSCYGFLAKGAKWKTTELYVVAPGVDALTVGRDLETWDSQVAFEVFGNQDINSAVDGPDTNTPDSKNEVMFGQISDPNVIAVAIVWGIFSGPPAGRELVEYDIVFNNVDYLWGDAMVNPEVMDFENIATHEFGHAAGMADLYQSQCSEQTMYGYASYGEVKKRTLEIGDINGIQNLYK